MHETKAIVLGVAMNLSCHLVFIFSACLCTNSATVTFITRTNKVIPYFNHKIHLISQLLGRKYFVFHMSFFFMTKSCTGILFTWKDNLIITSYRKRLEMLMWMSIYDRHDVVVKVLVYSDISVIFSTDKRSLCSRLFKIGFHSKAKMS